MLPRIYCCLRFPPSVARNAYPAGRCAASAKRPHRLLHTTRNWGAVRAAAAGSGPANAPGVEDSEYSDDAPFTFTTKSSRFEKGVKYDTGPGSDCSCEVVNCARAGSAASATHMHFRRCILSVQTTSVGV